jgi:hypothetical protein
MLSPRRLPIRRRPRLSLRRARRDRANAERPSASAAARLPRRLRELTAADVHQALTTMALRYSSAAVAMGHNALTRAIRHAEARDLVGRNVALLVETPKGQTGRPSNSLSLEQAAALLAAAAGTRMHAYITLCLATGIAPKRPGRCAGNTSTSATPWPVRPCRPARRCGDRSARTGYQDREITPDPGPARDGRDRAACPQGEASQRPGRCRPHVERAGPCLLRPDLRCPGRG